MRALADENVPRSAIVVLRASGHDVAWVREDARGAVDEDILARAQTEGRLLITFDKDFGGLAFARKLPASCGIVLFRLGAASAARVAEVVRRVLESRDDWAGHFSVVEADRIRMAPLR